MTPFTANLVQTITQAFTAQSEMALMTVAAFTAASLVLYGLTRGKEFLVAGYSAVLFLIPFMQT